ncbi:MAG TPA: VWA domain-containing protein [Bryobacteraceae bacterium]|nr:VWA domain-containing protein [Bryobacteraceae bacterium]
MRTAALFPAILLSCLAQDPIKVSVRLVNVAFTVRDANGTPVTNLTRDDFEVLDDGQRQPISFFARGEDLPLALGLIVDASGSQSKFVKQHERHLRAFLNDVLGPRDRALLLCFGNHLRLASDFSNSASEILEGLRAYEKKTVSVPEIGPHELRQGGTAFYDALYYSTLRKLVRTEQGRRALIVFSDGEDNSSAHTMMDVIEAAQAEDVTLFCIRYTETAKGEWTARNKYGASVMARLARETGGADFDAEKSDLRGSFRQIAEQLRSSYELAYHAGAADGTFHKLSIRVKQSGLTVRSKTGYYSSDATRTSFSPEP